MSMMADNIEHVITYWVLWQVFHSPALVGFQVISHWLPFLTLSVWFGSLAERFDCRRIIQVAQGLFAFVSLAWAVLFFTDSLQIWQACVLLVLHGCAGALWGPAEQLMLHDFAEPAELPSAVRLNATFKSLGVLAGPVVGSALLLGLGQSWGILANVLFYLPMTVLMLRTPFTGHVRDGFARTKRLSILDTFSVLRTVWTDKVLIGLVALGGLVAICIGTSMQVAMPAIGDRLGTGGGIPYGTLLFASGAGGVLGGLLLEASGRIRPTLQSAVVATVLLGVTTVVVATSPWYPLTLVALFLGGIASLAAMSIGQAVVQLRAPVDQRGRVVGVYSMVANGMRTGNGVSLALVGTAIGVIGAVLAGGIALVVGAAAIGALTMFARSRVQ
ncbi:MFS transporter [Aestuariimicrobium soli]|uniref:MFS transporter n=1 Tax=Aestuariimicrobium soli TaxID=2035834 RepID=UPI003EBD7150